MNRIILAIAFVFGIAIAVIGANEPRQPFTYSYR